MRAGGLSGVRISHSSGASAFNPRLLKYDAIAWSERASRIPSPGSGGRMAWSTPQTLSAAITGPSCAPFSVSR